MVGGDALVVLALWGLAVAQPLLDLFGKNPEFFVVNGLTTTEIVLFGLLVVLLGPVLLLGLEVLAYVVRPSLGRAVHVGTVAVLGAALGFTVLGQFEVDDSVIAVMVGVFGGVVGAYLECTVGLVRTGLRYLAFAPLLFLVAFLGFSPSADLLRGDPSAAIDPGRVGSPAPIVFLSLDEFPLASILRVDGTINAERFPNFARLAEQSFWFRNATSVAPTTTASVPATLTGRFPEAGSLPTYRDHPRSIFTLLGVAYDQHVIEQQTGVCPRVTCPVENEQLDVDRLWTSLTDAAAVYGHVVLPPSLRDGLPVVDRSWGGFIDDAGSGAAIEVFVPADADPPEPGEEPGRRYGEGASPTEADPSCPNIELWCGSARISELIDQIEVSGDRPALYLAHATLPHLPWLLSAEGHQYAPRSLVVDGLQLDGSWVEDTATVRQAFQRHLLQIGALDRLLGQMIDRLEAQGLWDEALVVVVADHGIAFTPGAQLRAPESSTLHEIYQVPLFIKAPHQSSGEVRPDNALTVDVLPTIVDLLDIDTDWEFDGESLVGDGPRREDKPVFFNGREGYLPASFENVLAVARRNATYLPFGDDWLGVAAVGDYGDLVGQPVGQVDTSGGSGGPWTADQAATLADWDPEGSALAPILLAGHVDLQGVAVPSEVLVVVNGTVAGVGVGVSTEADGRTGFRALIAEETLRPGANEVALLVPTVPGGRQFLVSPLSD